MDMSDRPEPSSSSNKDSQVRDDDVETVDGKDVGEHYREMTELGAHVKGEGEIK